MKKPRGKSLRFAPFKSGDKVVILVLCAQCKTSITSNKAIKVGTYKDPACSDKCADLVRLTQEQTGRPATHMFGDMYEHYLPKEIKERGRGWLMINGSGYDVQSGKNETTK